MLSPADMIVIGALALLFFGPDQLPKVARNAGKAIRDVQATSQSFIREMERAADEPEHESPRSPWTSPVAAEFHAEPGSTASEYHATASAAEHDVESSPAAAVHHAESDLTAAEHYAESGLKAAEHHAEPSAAAAPFSTESEVPISSEGSDARAKTKGESDNLGPARGVADVER